MSKIVINNESYLLQDDDQYMPYYFKKGGDMVRNPKTGETKPSEDKWIHTGTYHTSLQGAIKELAKVKVLSKEEYAFLQEYVTEYNNTYNFLTNCLVK